VLFVRVIWPTIYKELMLKMRHLRV